MNDERDPLLDEIAAALSVEPSSAFAAKVRAEVVSERMAWTWRAHLLVAAPVMLALTMAGAIAIDRDAPLESSVVGPAIAPAAPPPAPASPTPRARYLPARTEQAAAARVRPEKRPESEVLVPSDQAEGLRLWMAYVREGHAMLPPSRLVVNLDAGELPQLPEITRIEVPALTIEPLPGADETQNVRGLDD